jgi:formate dehydrogenase accessory protein FdhD
MQSPFDDSAAGALPAPLLPVAATELAHGATRQEQVAAEVPVALVLNGISHAVMMATPLDLEDFALGFALTEGLLRTPADLLDVEVEVGEDGVSLQMRVTAACEVRVKERRRTLAGRTGCGLCGIDSLKEVDRSRGHQVQAVQPALPALQRAMAGLKQAQRLNALCGGLHAAAWCSMEGEVQLLREDVGRHNALDKLIGARLNAGQAGDDGGFVAMSSRASVELVHKAVIAGAGALATVSAPTGLAVQLAAERGLALIGFVREGRATRYA